jgi:hypothetical protein
MTAFDHDRATKQCLIFVAAVCGVALATALLTPASAAEVPRWLAAWCSLVADLIPGVEGLSSPMPFRVQAYVTVAIMWTLLPLTSWWVYRGNWVMDINVARTTKRPWLPVVMSVLFLASAIGLAVISPDPDGVGFHARVLRKAAKSAFTFGIFAGLLFSAIAIGLGAIPKILRARRDAIVNGQT